VTPDDFRRLALALPEAVESSHMGTVDFRVGRIFATLGYPNANFGMVSLTREHQDMVVGVEPAVFRPVPGAWGLKGATLVVLARGRRAHPARGAGGGLAAEGQQAADRLAGSRPDPGPS
jgi:hypothetical protein